MKYRGFSSSSYPHPPYSVLLNVPPSPCPFPPFPLRRVITAVVSDIVVAVVVAVVAVVTVGAICPVRPVSEMKWPPTTCRRPVADDGQMPPTTSAACLAGRCVVGDDGAPSESTVGGATSASVSCASVGSPCDAPWTVGGCGVRLWEGDVGSAA